MIQIAPPIETTSWLRLPEFAWFVEAYGYAATQTKAIPALSKCSPEEMYYAFIAIMHGRCRKVDETDRLYEELKGITTDDFLALFENKHKEKQ